MLAVFLSLTLRVSRASGRGHSYSPGSTVRDHDKWITETVYGQSVVFDSIHISPALPFLEIKGGGAFEAHRCSDINLIGCRFVDCSADQLPGGAIYFDSVDLVNLQKCSFENCWSDLGGAFMLDGFETFVMEESNISKCSARSDRGGAFCADNKQRGNSSMLVKESRLEGNSGTIGGGCYVSHVANVDFQKTKLVLNDANKGAKSMFLSDYATGNFQRCRFYVSRVEGGYVSSDLENSDETSRVAFDDCCFNSTGTGQAPGVVHFLGNSAGSVTFGYMCFDLSHDESVLFNGADPSLSGSTYWNCENCRPIVPTTGHPPTPSTSVSPTVVPTTVVPSDSPTVPPSASPSESQTISFTQTPTSAPTETPTTTYSETASASFTDEGEHGGLSQTAITVLAVTLVAVFAIVLIVALVCIRRSQRGDLKLDTSALMTSTSQFNTNFSTVTEVLPPGEIIE